MFELPIVEMNAARHCVGLSDGRQVEYDLASLDTGSETDLRWLAGRGDNLLLVKPLTTFQAAWSALIEKAQKTGTYSLAIVGGGAAGVEIALNARLAFSRMGGSVKMALIAGDSGLLPGHPARAKQVVRRWLREADIEVLLEQAVSVENGLLLLSNGHHRPVDRVIAATGPQPPTWLASSKLHLDREGYVAVDSFNRSCSHSQVFAAGDICARAEDVPRSGVNAVRVGPVLAHNLLAAADARPLRRFRPRRRVMYLLANGAQRALLIFGWFSIAGRWLWRLKDRIDRRFVARFSAPTSKHPAQANANAGDSDS